MNFKTDDPLADLLSDNSNDDSFFESNLSKTRNVDPTPAVLKSQGKYVDLFGILEEPNLEVKSSLKSKTNSTLSSKPNKEAEPGFELKKPKSLIGSNTDSLFDDLFGQIDVKKNQESGRMPTEVRGYSANPISRQSTETENSTILQSRPKTSSGRRSSDNSSAATTNTREPFLTVRSGNQLHENRERISGPKKVSTADWLGLDIDSNEVEKLEVQGSSEERRKPQTNNPSQYEIVKEIQNSKAQIKETEDPLENICSSTPVREPSEAAVLMSTINIETQNTIAAIQQQEAQISLTAQMKNQEKVLVEMQRKQQELLAQQESQFNGLLQKQLLRQNILEQNIKNQQDRINAHIQLLLNQSVPSCETILPDISTVNSGARNQINEQEIAKLQTEVNTLQHEKLRLEEQVANIQTSIEKEIEIMEKFHKKQIQIFEDNLLSVEMRLQKEVETVKKFYSDKLEFNEKEKDKLRSEFETKINSLRQEHEEEMQRMKKTHEDDVESLQDDYKRMVSNIRQSKLMEFAAMQDNHSYLDTLRSASANLENVSGDLSSIRDELQYKINSLHHEREKKLEAREKKLEDCEKKLKMSEELAEEEKRRLMELVSSLEIQLSTLSKESADNNWILRQKFASLEAEKVTFEKEKSIIRDQLVSDEKRIEELKQMQLAETQKNLLMIQEEKSRLNLERIQLETAKKIFQNSDQEQSRQEIEASVKVAQDAAKSADKERERYLKMQRELEKQKRDLLDKENALQLAKEDLEAQTNSVSNNERRAKENLYKVRLAEDNCKAKIQFLQQKMREISEKEALISKDRLSLSQERVSLQKLKSKLNSTKCSLCRISQNIPNGTDSGVDGWPVERYSMVVQPSVLDRMLDENISQSLRQMMALTGTEFNEMESVEKDDNVNQTEKDSIDAQIQEHHVNSL